MVCVLYSAALYNLRTTQCFTNPPTCSAQLPLLTKDPASPSSHTYLSQVLSSDLPPAIPPHPPNPTRCMRLSNHLAHSEVVRMHPRKPQSLCFAERLQRCEAHAVPPRCLRNSPVCVRDPCVARLRRGYKNHTQHTPYSTPLICSLQKKCTGDGSLLTP